MIENLGDKANTNGFDKNPDNAKLGGRKPSIKKQIIELMTAEGAYMIEKKNVIKVYKNGNVKVKIPTQMQIAMKLNEWAMSKKGNDSIRAIQLIMDHIDGKGVQPIDLTSTEHKGMPKVNIIIKEHNPKDG